MLIKVTTPMVDALGRSFRRGAHRTLPDEEAQSFIAAGCAKRIPPDPEKAAGFLKDMGAGLLILPGTDPELIEAAKAENLELAKLKAKAKK